MNNKLFPKEHKDNIAERLLKERDELALKEATLELAEGIKKSVQTNDVEETLPVKKKTKSYFTTSKRKRSYDIEGTSLQPTKLTMSGGNFETKYRKQLSNIVFNGDADVDPDALLSLLILTEAIKTERYPVYIRACTHKSFNERIVKVLNSFFSDNLKILEEIFKMFTETSRLPDP